MTQKIAIFTYALTGGGVERTVAILASEFANRGYAVDLLTIRACDPHPVELAAAVNIIPLVPTWLEKSPIPGFRLLTGSFTLTHYLRHQRPDVLLSMVLPLNVCTIFSRFISATKTRLVISEAATITPEYLQIREHRADKFWWFLAKRLYKNVDQLIAISRGQAAQIIQEIPVIKNRITAIHNPAYHTLIDTAAQAPPPHPWLMDKTLPVCVAVGRLVTVKGFDNLLHAFQLLQGELPCRLIIVGEGPERKNLEMLVQTLNLSHAVAMPGYDANPYAYMARADLFVMSSRSEGLGNVLIEALACGCQSVATDCPSGPAEILEQGKYGRLVPVDDPQALAAAMLATLQDPLPPALLKQRVGDFRPAAIATAYLKVLFPKI